MKEFKLNSIFGLFALSLLFISSCTNEKEAETNENISTSDGMENSSNQDTLKITLNSNDRMQYDQSEISVFEGQTIVLTLIHTGTMPITAMGHNFVLLTKGTLISEFAKEALKAKNNEYIPQDESNIIAYTGLIGGGERVTITFDAPEMGTYDFLCSFPGHYSIMKGKFNVK